MSEEWGRLFDVADPYEDDDDVRLLRGGVVVAVVPCWRPDCTISAHVR